MEELLFQLPHYPTVPGRGDVPLVATGAPEVFPDAHRDAVVDHGGVVAVAEVGDVDAAARVDAVAAADVDEILECLPHAPEAALVEEVVVEDGRRAGVREDVGVPLLEAVPGELPVRLCTARIVVLHACSEGRVGGWCAVRWWSVPAVVVCTREQPRVCGVWKSLSWK